MALDIFTVSDPLLKSNTQKGFGVLFKSFYDDVSKFFSYISLNIYIGRQYSFILFMFYSIQQMVPSLFLSHFHDKYNDSLAIKVLFTIFKNMTASHTKSDNWKVYFIPITTIMLVYSIVLIMFIVSFFIYRFRKSLPNKLLGFYTIILPILSTILPVYAINLIMEALSLESSSSHMLPMVISTIIILTVFMVCFFTIRSTSIVLSTTPISLLKILGNAIIFIIIIVQFVIEFYFKKVSDAFQYILFSLSILFHIIEFPILSYYGFFLRSYEESIFFGCTITNLIVTCITASLYWTNKPFQSGILAGMSVFITAFYVLYNYHILRRRIRSLIFLNKLEEDNYFFVDLSPIKVSQLAIDGIAIMHPYVTSMKFFNNLLENGDPDKLEKYAKIALIFYAIQPYYDEQMKDSLTYIDSKYRSTQAQMLSIHRDMSLSEELKRQVELIKPSIEFAQIAVGKFFEAAVVDSQRDMIALFHKTAKECRMAHEQVTRLVNSFPNNQFALMYAARFYTNVMGNANLAADFFEKAHCTVYYQNDDIPFKSEQNLFQAYPRVVAHHYEAPVEGDPIARDMQANPGEFHDSIKMNLCSFSERLVFPSVIGLILPFIIVSIGIAITSVVVTAGWNNRFIIERTLLMQFTYETELIRTHMREIQLVVSLAILEANGTINGTNYLKDFHDLYTSVISTFHTLTNMRYLDFKDQRLINARNMLFQPTINFTYFTSMENHEKRMMSVEEMTYNLLEESLNIVNDPINSLNSTSIANIYMNSDTLLDSYHSVFLEMGDYIIHENKLKKAGLASIYVILLILIIAMFLVMIIVPNKFIIRDCFNIIRCFRSIPRAALSYVNQRISEKHNNFLPTAEEVENAYRLIKPHENPIMTSGIKLSNSYLRMLLLIALLHVAQVLLSSAHFFIVNDEVGKIFQYNYDVVDSYYCTIEAIGYILTYAAHPIIKDTEHTEDFAKIIMDKVSQATSSLDRAFYGTGPIPSIVTKVPSTKRLIFNPKNNISGVNHPSNIDRFLLLARFIGQISIDYVRNNETIDLESIRIPVLWAAARDYVFPRLFDFILKEIHIEGAKAANSWITICIIFVSIFAFISVILTVVLSLYFKSQEKDMRTVLELIFNVPTKTILKSRYITTLITEDFRVLPTDFSIDTDSANSIIINTPSPVIMINTETKEVQINLKAKEIGFGTDIDPRFMLGTCLDHNTEKIVLLGNPYNVNLSVAGSNRCYILTEQYRLKFTQQKLEREEMRQEMIINRVIPIGISDKLTQVDSIVAALYLISGSMNRVATALDEEKKVCPFFDYYTIINDRCYIFYGLVSRAARSDVSKEAIRSCLRIIGALRNEKFAIKKRYEGRFRKERNWFNIRDSEITAPKFFLNYHNHNEEEDSSDVNIFDNFSDDSNDIENRKYDDDMHSVSSAEDFVDENGYRRHALFANNTLFPFAKPGSEEYGLKANVNPDESTSGSSIFDSLSHNLMSSNAGTEPKEDESYPKPVYDEPRIMPKSPIQNQKETNETENDNQEDVAIDNDQNENGDDDKKEVGDANENNTQEEEDNNRDKEDKEEKEEKEEENIDVDIHTSRSSTVKEEEDAEVENKSEAESENKGNEDKKEKEDEKDEGEVRKSNEEEDVEIEIDESEDDDGNNGTDFVYIRYSGEKKQIEIEKAKLPRSPSFREVVKVPHAERARRFSDAYMGPEIRHIFESEGGISVRMGISMIDVATVCYNCNFDLFGPDIDFASLLAKCARPGELAMGQVVFEHAYGEGYRIRQIVTDLSDYGEVTVYCIHLE